MVRALVRRDPMSLAHEEMITGASSRVDEAFGYLKATILSTKLAPGTAINELQLAAQLGISRTPVREAVRKLEQEGLVVRLPNRGVIVRELSLRTVLDIWQVREILEPTAARMAAGRVDPSALDVLEAGLRRLRYVTGRLEDYEASHALDVDLHRLVARSTGNDSLARTIETMNDRVSLVRMVSSPTRFHRSIDEHCAVVAALRAGDASAAHEAMLTHLVNAREGLYSRG